MAVPALVILLLVAASVGSVTIASLALADVFSGWGVFLFYTLPAIFFGIWTVREFSPQTWRRTIAPFRRAWRGTRLGRPAAHLPPREPLPPARPRRAEERGALVEFLLELFEAALKPFLQLMRPILAAWRTPHARRWLNVLFGLAAVAIAALVAWEFSQRGWPLERAKISLTAAAGALFLLTYALKALGWQRLFRVHERPRSLGLAAATGASAVTGLALPGRFDDAVRIAIVRKLPGRRPGVGTLVLSLFLLGMVDTVALAPFAAVAAAMTDTNAWVRAAFGVVAGAGVGAAAVLAVIPRLSGSTRLGRFRLTHWLNKHAPASSADALTAAVLVVLAWAARAAGIFILFSALGFSVPFALALAYLAGSAASAALPIAPAGAATQAGVGAAVLATTGIDAAEAVAFAVAAQSLTVLAGALVVLWAVGLHGARRAFAH